MTNESATGQKRRAWSSDEETFNSDSLGELIELMDDPKPGDVVYVGEVVSVDVSRLCNSEDVIDTMADRAWDFVGEHADDYPCVSGEAKTELDMLLADWIRKHCPPTFYQIANAKPYALTAEDLS